MQSSIVLASLVSELAGGGGGVKRVKSYFLRKPEKGHVKLIQWVKTAQSCLQSVSNLFYFHHFKLAYVVLHMAVKGYFEAHF